MAMRRWAKLTLQAGAGNDCGDAHQRRGDWCLGRNAHENLSQTLGGVVNASENVTGSTGPIALFNVAPTVLESAARFPGG